MPEILQDIKPTSRRSLASFSDAKEMFSFARDYVMANRRDDYEKSLWSIRTAASTPLTEHRFMREYVWCVHVAGMKAVMISKIYDALLQAHGIENERGEYIPITSDNLFIDKDKVYSIWNHKPKCEAVQKTRTCLFLVPACGNKFAKFCELYVHDVSYENGYVNPTFGLPSPEKLRKLPFMGPALSCQLARNLGNPSIVKPDVHMNRLATVYGYSDASAMCNALSDAPAGETDLLIWVAAVDNGTR
jgi:hypothetical protein